MKNIEKNVLKAKIDKADVISFDVFDTLVFRITNEPEIIFDIVGRHFGIFDFRKIRMLSQDTASRKVYEENGYPHADINDIYEELSRYTEYDVDWNVVKEYEIELERDAIVANPEMMEIYRYAKKKEKRVIATSDMYLTAKILENILYEKGYTEIDHAYCSADEHKAKFNRDLFEAVADQENTAYRNILHIGDKEKDDGEYPASYGMDHFIYKKHIAEEMTSERMQEDIGYGIYKILSKEGDAFWYNLGLRAGGSLYVGLYSWLEPVLKNSNNKAFFLSRGGYILYNLFKEAGFENVEYLLTSRRSMIMAAITEMNDKDIESLPPYTIGQTVGEVLDYLCVDKKRIKHLKEAGFSSFETTISSKEEMDRFHLLYRYDRDVFLERCQLERENALLYLNKAGFFDKDAYCFDCGWHGSSQEIIERLKKAAGIKTKHDFYYFGIRNSEKSRKQLHGLHYETYLFDFYRNYSIQNDVDQNAAMYELFFSAPHESVFYYGEDGEPVFEEDDRSDKRSEIYDSIADYVSMALPFMEKYHMDILPEDSVAPLKRLIHEPTPEEAVIIGNICDVDGFVKKNGESKYFAYVKEEELPFIDKKEIYWPEGLLHRPDISEKIKEACAKRFGIEYPEKKPEYHLEDEQDIRNYHRVIRQYERSHCEQIELSYHPSFSFVVPVYNTVSEQLEECINSILSQNYDNYEAVFVDDHSTWDCVRPVLEKYESNKRVKIKYRDRNGNISVATNDGIEIATGDFIVFMDCDDIVEPDALYEFAKKLNENPDLDFIYSDEDKITEDGKIRHMPFFKPDWSPDLFLNMMYTNHLATYRASIVREIGGLRSEYNGSQDYDFTLRFIEKTEDSRIGHVSKILYHWRERKESAAYKISSKNYAIEAGKCAKDDYIKRNTLRAHTEFIYDTSQYRIIYEPVGEPKVNIIIPSKDNYEVLKRCINSIIEFTTYKNYEIIVVDNGSSSINRQMIDEYLSELKIKYIYDRYDFNFSKMCNVGADYANGDYLLFLNDDIELFQPDWLSRMLGQACQKHVGAVGAKLFYPETSLIQHDGVEILKEGPSHKFYRLDNENNYYFGFNKQDFDCISVTGACMLLSAEKFVEVSGFDEGFAVAYNDVDLCLKLYENGYYNVLRNDVCAYHHESISRGDDSEDDRKFVRLSAERLYLWKKHKNSERNDPFLNNNIYRHWIGPIFNIRQDELLIDGLSLSDTDEDISTVIDYINSREDVQILGWSFVLSGEFDLSMKRYLVLKDPYENVYYLPVNSMSRGDVVEATGRQDLLFSGFECRIAKSKLRFDYFNYRIGMLIVENNGKKHFRWTDTSTTTIRSPRKRTEFRGALCVKGIVREANKKVRFFVDNINTIQDGLFINGWAIYDENNHYKYKKELLLEKQDNTIMSVAVIEYDRLDIAYTFPDIHFLCNAGFEGLIWKYSLTPGDRYKIYLRFVNIFSNEDINDVYIGYDIDYNKDSGTLQVAKQ